MTSSTDYDLGYKIGDMLLQRGLETPMTGKPFNTNISDTIAENHESTMTALGLDMADDSLYGTPRRIAKMYTQEIFWGLDYAKFPACTTVENKMGYDEMIVVDDINVMSCCEHHFVPFIGRARIGYIPKNKVLGLSKFNRVVDFFCRRPQIQERLTEQISAALSMILETDDVAVVIKAEHLCVKLRGVKDQNSSTSTSKLSGRFRSVEALRTEFLLT